MIAWTDSPIFRFAPIRSALLLAAIVVFVIAATTPFDWPGQALFALLLWCCAMFARQIVGNMTNLIMVLLSLLATLRYAWWRVTQTIPEGTGWEFILGIVLLAAEAYCWLILIFGYLQTAWPLKRAPAALPSDMAAWPTVDVFIPTYNEPLAVLKPTVLAALALDWPRDKLNVYVLDDGRREECRQFAAAAGAHYITRPNNAHAKAGNLNHALAQTQGEFVTVFDCDHLPTRSFLKTTMGWFLKDPRCAILQTPHHFFSPDPFERNLNTFRRVPNEGNLFYGLIQDGNDFWNATFFCGSCAVLRRKALDDIGGVAIETVTEDAHTALKMHRLGYTSAYINITQAAGLATESLSGHVGQRIRWARGMAQIFRIDNPFLGRGLDFFQRICYGNAMLHFFYGIPRLIFLLAPMAFLYFEIHIFHAAASMVALYALPHILLANLTNAHIQGKHRHSFWSEIYETVLAWYIMLPTTVAFINPKAGKFNVTTKGGTVEQAYFDWTISKPYIALVCVNLIGLALGLVRLFFWNPHETGTVVLNLAWTSLNLVILGAAIGVATESRQVRIAHRVSTRLKAALHFADGNSAICHTEDYSMSGLGLQLERGRRLPAGEKLLVSLWDGLQEHVFPARVIVCRGKRMGVQFESLSLAQESELIQCTFARADAWANWKSRHDGDHPLHGLREIVDAGINGYATLMRHMIATYQNRKKQSAGSTPGRKAI